MGRFENVAFHLRAALLMVVFLFGTLALMNSVLTRSNVQSRNGTEVCRGVREVDQVVFILIDAIRPDFVLPGLAAYYDHGTECNAFPATPSTDRIGTLKYIEESLRNATHPSQGYIAYADSPTTTFQRLKAVVTGTLPAFLDAGGNINTDEVVNDNLLRQLRGRSVLLGDATWLHLFPSHEDRNRSLWKKVIAHPPYNVSDFDTNDHLVIESIFPLLDTETVEKDPNDHAKFIVAHFLGVDHIGHRINAYTPLMDDKLNELDMYIRNVTQYLQQRASETRTLVLILGDHGMTNSGDHGGGSFRETDTFMYAEFIDGASRRNKTPYDGRRSETLTRERWDERFDEDLDRLASCRTVARVLPEKLSAIHQIDLVPTVAALLGVPIPFGSLGRIIPELMTVVDPQADIASLEECNMRQLRAFFESEEEKPPRNAPWLLKGYSNREMLAKTGHYARKTRNEMHPVEMFVGSILCLLAAFSIFWNTDVLYCIKGGSLVGAWVLLLYLFRVCAVFANSFIVKEDVEVLCLLQLLLVTALFSIKCSAKTTAIAGASSILPILLCVRLLGPLFGSRRSHITHAVEETYGINDIITTYAPYLREERDSIFVGSFIFLCWAKDGVQRCGAILLCMVLSLCYQKPILHHVGPLGVFILAFFMRDGAPLRYMAIVLWVSTLCNENYVAGCAISMYGALLIPLLRATHHLPVAAQAVMLHFVAWVGFYTQGNQCIFSTIDLNASFVGLKNTSILLGAVFVVARTFNATAFPLMATLLVHKENRSRGFRLCYLFLYYTVVQASISCFNVYIQKSHLMLFTIFCPKVMFDVVMCVAAAVGYIMALLIC